MVAVTMARSCGTVAWVARRAYAVVLLAGCPSLGEVRRNKTSRLSVLGPCDAARRFDARRARLQICLVPFGFRAACSSALPSLLHILRRPGTACFALALRVASTACRMKTSSTPRPRKRREYTVDVGRSAASCLFATITWTSPSSAMMVRVVLGRDERGRQLPKADVAFSHLYQAFLALIDR